MRLPAKPAAAVTPSQVPIGKIVRAAKPAVPTSIPPTGAAIVPRIVTPPDVPASTRRRSVTRRGAARENAPISVDHVSADAAAAAQIAAATHGAAGL